MNLKTIAVKVLFLSTSSLASFHKILKKITSFGTKNLLFHGMKRCQLVMGKLLQWFLAILLQNIFNSMRKPFGLDSLTIMSWKVMEKLSQHYENYFLKKYAEAQELSKQKMVTPQNGMSYQPSGDVYLRFSGHDNPQNYYRDLNISKATSTVSYEIDGVRYKRTAIASLSENVIAVHCEASKAKSLNFSVSLNSAHQIKQVLVKNGLLVLTGTPAEQEKLASKVNYEVDVKSSPKMETLRFQTLQLM
jgi:hypothetical protein